MLCNGGRLGGGKEICGIRELIDDIRRNPGPERWTEQTNASEWFPRETGYRSLFWTSPLEQGRDPVPYASGAFNQRCYIDVVRKTVLVKFSSLPLLDSTAQGDNPPEADDVAIQSFLQVLPKLVR